MSESTIEELAIALANAKDAEAQAKDARIQAEEALADAIGGRDIGSTSVKAGRFSITVKRGYNYKIDAPKNFASNFPDFVRITEKIDVYAKAYEEAREADSPIYREMAAHVTATPKKVAVELKL